MRPVPRRRGVSLVEVLVALAIVGVCLAVLLPAVQRVRLAAARAAAFNSTRQVLVATHAYSNAHDGLLPTIGAASDTDKTDMSVVCKLCPYLEADRDDPPRFLRWPSDPSVGLAYSTGPPAPTTGPGGQPVAAKPPDRPCSVAFSATVYVSGTRLPASVPDGLSGTLALGEHYGKCGPTTFLTKTNGAECFTLVGSQLVPTVCVGVGQRAPTFAAHPNHDDVYPVTTNGVTTGSLPLTFQVRPPLDQCDPRIPNSSLPGGILAGMLDGSARFVRPGVSPEVFWGTVTPAGGEVVGLD